MSVVRNYMVLPGVANWDKIDEFNDHVGHPKMRFVDVSEHGGGVKCVEAEIWLAAANYEPSIEDMVSKFHTFPWDEPENALLLHKDQEAEIWTACEVLRNSYKFNSVHISYVEPDEQYDEVKIIMTDKTETVNKLLEALIRILDFGGVTPENLSQGRDAIRAYRKHEEKTDDR